MDSNFGGDFVKGTIFLQIIANPQNSKNFQYFKNPR